MEGIKQICTKELARVFKDGKMLISVFVFPVAIMIVVMSLVSNLTSRMEKDVEAHKSIVYIENVPEEFKEFLLAADKDVSIYTEKNIGEVLRLETKGALDESQRRKEAETAIKEGSIDLMIEFPQGFSENVYDYQTGDEIPQVKTYYNPSEEYSKAAFEKISNGVLESYRQTLLSQRVPDMAGLTVFTVNADNPDMIVQDKEKAGGKVLGTMLPYFITILLFAGAMGIGTDMIAGEKERGTLASLLVSPVKRSSIVLGKVFALMIISGATSVVYVAAMVAFMPQMMGGLSGKELGIDLSLRPEQIAMLAILLIAIAFLYSAVIVLVSVFAKTIKEANSYMMPVYMVILLLGITTMFTTGSPKEWFYVIPIYNTSLTLQGILTQEVTMAQYGMTLGVTLLTGGILIAAIAKAFESEKVMAV
ncbi:ABC transporter permease [Faecalicatena acetigenes]|uniref:ABC transporter permease n=1 Tax=Faecalicatena acetigenes TaxID=2981790 RepID=A0ABT2TCY5_9FIRM|nr:ABC transporter permease [Faecalicatena acetigenes]MCU6747732.1 ABC transporter permease [Faecalicatena acetigenes]SCI05422.1 ABC-type transport system involved in multi-copper enzyme maturation%2C permease component [uncultured Clostridium sp.]